MFYNTNSYEHIKEQLEERWIEHARLRRADAVAKGRQGVQPTLVGHLGLQPTLVGHLGRTLIRFGV